MKLFLVGMLLVFSVAAANELEKTALNGGSPALYNLGNADDNPYKNTVIQIPETLTAEYLEEAKALIKGGEEKIPSTICRSALLVFLVAILGLLWIVVLIMLLIGPVLTALKL